jgi:hypothetical protein
VELVHASYALLLHELFVGVVPPSLYFAQVFLSFLPSLMLFSLTFKLNFCHSLCLTRRNDKNYNEMKMIIHNYISKIMVHLTIASTIISFLPLRFLHMNLYVYYYHLTLNEKIGHPTKP